MKETYNLVAPDIDYLLRQFDRRFRNSSSPSKELMAAVDPLFTALSDLAPLKKNKEAKSIWLMIPRGALSDYEQRNPYEDMLEWEEVSNRAEYEERWKSEYPDDICWYELVITEDFDRDGKLCFRGVGLDKHTIISADLDRSEDKADRNDDAAISLCSLLTAAANQSMNLLRDGKYNFVVSSSLPFQFRTGVVKRSIVWESEPGRKKGIFEGLSDAVYTRFQELADSGENDVSRIHPLKTMTGNDFLFACAIGYRACGYNLLDKKGNEMAPVDLYIRYADGRDEGLTGKGDIMHSVDGGIDLDDPKAWDDWYHNRSMRGGHPWEVCRGGNSTHIDLYVRDSRKDVEWKLKMGEINQKEANENQKNGGYYFSVNGHAWSRSVEAVNFYVALHDAGLPVILQDADGILARFRGEDLIGIVPHNIIPIYCNSLFPESCGKIYDSMHVQEDDAWLKNIEWLPEDGANLL